MRKRASFPVGLFVNDKNLGYRYDVTRSSIDHEMPVQGTLSELVKD